MRIRSLFAAAALSVAAALPLAGTALAAQDRDCKDFASQAEAQAAFDSRAGDPERLDANDNGVACENEEYGVAAPASGSDDDQVTAKPVGGVEAGGGPASDGSGVLVAVLGASAAGGVGAVAARRFARKAG